MLNKIELNGYSYVTINPASNGLMVLTHKDTTVEMNGSTLVIKDPTNNTGMLNGIVNYFNGVHISGNNNMVNCNNYNVNGYSFNSNMGNGYSYNVNNISKSECNTEHLIECIPDITHMTLSGAMSVETDVVLNKNCNLKVEGSGGINYHTYGQHYNNLSISLKGSGDIKMNHAYECTINNLSVSLTGSGDVKLNGNMSNANLILSGSGDMKINGTINQATIVLTGSGDIDGFSVEKWVNVTLTGSGKVKGKSIGYVEDGNYKHTIITKNKTGSGSIKIN